MIKGFKVRLEPNNKQNTMLFKCAGTSRFIYNWTLARQEENYKNGDKFVNDGILRKEITQLKKGELYWLNEVSNNIAKQSVKDACNAYKRFFKRQTKKPRFKSKKKSMPSFYNDVIKIQFKETCVRLEKIGWIKLSENNKIPFGNNVKYMNPRITYDGIHWYVSVNVKVENIKPVLSNISVGIDLGIKDLAIVSNIDKPFQNINKTHRVKKFKKRIRRLQRQISRKYEMNKDGKKYVKTNNIKKLEYKYNKLQKHLNFIREDYIQKTTTKLVKTKPSRVVMEDLNVSGLMKNKYLAKAVQEQCFYRFITIMKYKCEKYGIEFVQADRFYPSSKTCSNCGNVKTKLSLSERTYICEECGLEIDRDRNASINLSRYNKVS
ncbi:TPA: transposase [Clostridium botulinum]|nr:transposase [Clostridium botulinum]